MQISKKYLSLAQHFALLRQRLFDFDNHIGAGENFARTFDNRGAEFFIIGIGRRRYPHPRPIALLLYARVPPPDVRIRASYQRGIRDF